MQKWIFLLFSFLFTITSTIAQNSNLSAEELFKSAREQAFEKKDYPAAISTMKMALQKSPDYTDLSVFLGRLYTWSNQIDDARQIFEPMMSQNIESDDFYLAYASLEYWSSNPSKALQIVEKGLGHSPQSEDLLLLSTKIYNNLFQYEKAEAQLTKLFEVNPKSTEGRQLAARIRDLATKNAVGVTYNYVHFDKQFKDDWHIVGLSYKRSTKHGPVTFRTNYANKFADNGVQFEVEAYPRLSKLFYMYVGAGYSNNVGVFPKYRTGVSLYANLPKGFEGEVGFRQLYFDDHLFMYTASVSKYMQNFWVNLRTFITPANSNIAHTYIGSIRYYTKGTYDYFGINIGTGISPEESRNNLLGNSLYKMKTFRVGLDYYFTINKRNQFSITGTYFNQEFRPQLIGNQIDVTLGYIRNF